MDHPTSDSDAAHGIPFAQAAAYWLRLGFVSFGGPAGQIAILHEDLVERRRWISERRFLHALNYCMVLPGPEAQQLATYIGWLMHRTRGGIVAGGLFVLPSLVILIALSWLYMAYGHVPAVAGVFHGIKPAVAALVAHAAHRIGSRTLKNDRRLQGIAVAAFVAIFAFGLPFPLIVLAAGIAGHFAAPIGRGPAAAHARSATPSAPPPALPLPPGATPAGDRDASPPDAGSPRRAADAAIGAPLIGDDMPPPAHARFAWPRFGRILAVGLALWLAAIGALAAAQGWHAVLTQMAWFFTKAALLTFGGAYAVLPYVYQGAVEHYQWLTPAQMIDGLALGETTPGPLIMVVAFVGFVGGWTKALFGADALFLAGAAAAAVVTFFTFLPSFLFVLLGAPFIESTRGNLKLTAPLAGITAAVVGVIVQLAVFFAYHVLWPRGWGGGFDWPAALIGLAAAVALFRYKVGVITVVLGAGAAGLAITLAAGAA